MEPTPITTQQQVNTTDIPQQDTRAPESPKAEVSERKAVSMMDLIGVDKLIQASIAAVPAGTEAAQEKKTEITEGKPELPSVKFTVNGVTITGRIGDTVKVPPIKILQGLTLDMSSSSLMIIGVNNGVAQAAAVNDARVIITMGNASAYTQILEVPASNIVLSGRDQISAAAESAPQKAVEPKPGEPKTEAPKAGVPKPETKPDSGEIFGLIGQLALILPGIDTPKGQRPMGDVLVSGGGTLSTKGLICTNGCSRIDDKGVRSLNTIKIIEDGIFADDEKVNLELTAPVEEKAEELASQLDNAIPAGSGEEKPVVNIFSGEILDLLFEIFKIGPAALANKKLAGKLELLDIKDEDEEKFTDALKDLAKKKGMKILGQMWKDRKHFKKNGKTSVKDWFKGLWYGARQGVVNVLQDTQKLSKYTKETIKALEDLGIPNGLLKGIDDQYSKFTQSSTDWMSKKLKVPNEPQKEEKEDDKKLEVELKILPGLFALKFSISPKINLSIGGSTDITGMFDQFVFDINGSGELGLDFGAAAVLGNAIIALEAAVNAGALFAGGLDGANKIFEISGFTIQVVSNNGENPYAWVQGDSHLDLKVDLKLYLAFGLAAKSEIIGWGKDIVSRKLESVLGSVSINEDVYKRGQMMSVHGWHTRNGSITTSFLNGAKGEVMKLAGNGNNNIGGVSDFILSISDNSKKIEDLNKDFEALNKDFEDFSKDFKTLQDKMGDVKAMIFSKEKNASNVKLAEKFDALCEKYKSVVNLSIIEINRINNVIDQYKQHVLVKDGESELKNLIAKRDARIRWVNEYKANHADGLEKGKITRKEVLQAYDNAFKDRGGGYARFDKNKRTEQAQSAVYNANAILSYELDRLKEKTSIREARVDQLQAVLDENPGISGRDFIKKYHEIRGTTFFGNEKGFFKHIVENSVALGIFSPEDLKFSIEKYEVDRAGEKEGDDLFAFLRSDAKFDADKQYKNIKVFDAAFNQNVYKADEKAWRSYVKSRCSVNDILNYEKGKLDAEAGKDETGQKQKRVDLINDLRVLRNKYRTENDPNKKAEHLKSGRELFQNKDYLDEATRKGLFDKANRYKTQTADQLRAQIKSIGTVETYIKYNKDSVGEHIKDLEGDDSAKHNTELTRKDNIKIYKKYVKYVIDSKDYASPVFSIQNILDYEAGQIDKYKKEKQNDSNQKHLAGHEERQEFLQDEQKKIIELGNLSQEDAAAATRSAIDMYFTGVRPQGHYKKNVEVGGGISEDTLRADVSKASGYLKVLKDTDQTPPTRQGMIQALKWYIVDDQRLLGRDNASKAVEKTKTANRSEIYDTWKNKLQLDRGANLDWINVGLDEVTEQNYDLDDMINYLTYAGGGDNKHFNRYNVMREMKDSGSSEDEIKEYYSTVLDGKLFAELAVNDPNLVTSNVLSPADFVRYIYKGEGAGVMLARSPKHEARVKKIRETPDDAESVRKLAKWYIEDEGAERFSNIMTYEAFDRGLLTPETVVEFERAKSVVGSVKHNARLVRMYAVFDQQKQMDEEAKAQGRPVMSEEEKRNYLEDNILAVYQNNENKGGAGFESARFKDMDKRREAIAESRTGADELQSILEYENSRKEFWEKSRKNLTDKIAVMELKKAKASSEMEAAQQKIGSINKKLEVLRKGTTNLGEAKDSIKQADNEIKIMTETEQATKDVMKMVEDVNKLEDQCKAEIAQLHAQAEEEDKERRTNAG